MDIIALHQHITNFQNLGRTVNLQTVTYVLITKPRTELNYAASCQIAMHENSGKGFVYLHRMPHTFIYT